MRALSFIMILALTPPVFAQLEKARENLARAESNSEGDPEGRAILLIEAYRLVEEAEAPSAAKRSLISKIRTILTKIDPQAIARIKDQRNSAQELIQSAIKYQEAGWKRTARRTLDLALELDPYVTPDLVTEIEKKLQGENSELIETFEGAIYPFGGKVWTFTDEWIASPGFVLDSTQVSPLLQSTRVISGNYKISLKVMIGDKPGSLGITIGGTDRAKSFHMVGLEFSDSKSTLSLHSFARDRFTQLEDEDFELNENQRAYWLPIEINVSEGSLSAVAAGKQSLSVEIDGALDGTMGFLISGFTRNPDPVRFRHLKITQLR